MKFKHIHLVYFSPTETGKRNLLAAAEVFDLEKTEHNITCEIKDLEFNEDDLVFFVAPVYSGRIPKLAKDRIEHIKGNNTTSILFAVYGNRDFDDALAELQSVTESNGFKTIAGLAVIGQHTFTSKVATSRPDENDKDSLKKLMSEVKQKLENDSFKPLKMPGNVPVKTASRLALTPKTNEKCSHCNICMNVCPSQAINNDNFDIPDANLCISCLACVINCPEDARKVNPIKQAPIAKTLELSCKKRKEIQLFI